MKNKLIIAIDFDGTIVDHKYPEIGATKPNVVNVLKRLLSEGHTLIIWTCRGGSELIAAYDWLTLKGLEGILVNVNASYEQILFQPSPKIYADIYIDDRNLGGIPEDWEEIYKLINESRNI
ncbi:hypothetical protein LCGC14_0536880 [marine sediment metagenome]|uniref:Hydrolase n=1 Tax=marine sediment metagenome TaxID=412755 RepID=A0A0F9V238_9ZZZZ